MVQEALRRDKEEAEKLAVNEHDSDGAMDMIDLGGIALDDDENYIESEIAQIEWQNRELERLMRDKQE